MSHFPNIGSVKSLYVFGIDEIQVSVNAQNNTASVIVDALIEINDRKIIFEQDSIAQPIEWQDDDNAGIWEIALSGLIPNTSDTAKEHYALLFKQCIAIVETMSGQLFVLGSSASPLFPKKIKRNTPKKVTDNKTYAFDLIGVSITEPPEVVSIS